MISEILMNFLKDVKEILDENGIFILEHADLYSIIKNNVLILFVMNI